MTTINELIDELSKKKPLDFKPYFHSNGHGSLTVFFKDEAYYSQSLTDDITLYKSLDTEEIVGCKVFVGGVLVDRNETAHNPN